MGRYATDEGSVRPKGTPCLVLHPHGINMRGRRVGLSYGGRIMTGWGGMDSSAEEARDVIEHLEEENRGAHWTTFAERSSRHQAPSGSRSTALPIVDGDEYA